MVAKIVNSTESHSEPVANKVATTAHKPERAEMQVISEASPASLVKIGGTEQEEFGWVKGPRLEQLREAKPFRWDIGEISVLLLIFEGKLQAFDNRCAHMGLPLEKGVIDFKTRTLLCPYHAYRFDCASGKCFNFPQLQLTVYPVQIKEDQIWLKLT